MESSPNGRIKKCCPLTSEMLPNSIWQVNNLYASFLSIQNTIKSHEVWITVEQTNNWFPLRQDAAVIQSVNLVCYFIVDGLCYFLFSIFKIILRLYTQSQKFCFTIGLHKHPRQNVKWRCVLNTHTGSFFNFFALACQGETDFCLNIPRPTLNKKDNLED